MSDPKNILVTGFGPFGQHKVNASWEAVKLLKKYKIEGHNIVVEQLDVSYREADEKIAHLWSKYRPVLVVHVGVSHLANKITIESQANRTGYVRSDCEDCFHPTGVACPNGNECIVTGVDITKLCAELQQVEVDFCKSNDAGRYLCEYTYYKSLQQDPSRTLFVHVPMLGKPYSAEQLAKGIYDILVKTLRQVS